MSEGQAEVNLDGYYQFWNSADKKGYSGTAIFTKIKPLSSTTGMGIDEHDHEGRIITLEYKDFYFVNVYVPNVKRDLARLTYRMKWEDDFREYVNNLDKIKPVIICGDLNVAHENIDIKNYKTNHGNAGFTTEERNKFTELLQSGFVDSFRYLYPDKEGAYSWFSYMHKARERNMGWRIDYFVVSKNIQDKIKEAEILPSVDGSDHCPVVLHI